MSMKKKDILELKKRFKKDKCTFTKLCGCYVNGEKHIVFNFRETFLNLDEDEYFKYLEIAKKVLSGTLGNNLLELNFPVNEELINEKQVSLMALKNSQLKDDTLLEDFYNSIIESYNYEGNFLILLFHDAYDIITKTKDNLKLDESEEVYEYILCAICPVSLSKPGLRCFEEENTIKARLRDWVVESPSNGFLFPAFIDRSTDVNSLVYYTKDVKDTRENLIEDALGCSSKQTATIQKELFKSAVIDSLDVDEKKAERIFMDIQDNINTLVEEHNAAYEGTDVEPITITEDTIQEILLDSGVPEESTAKIEKSYLESFKDEAPLAEHLLDSKLLKASEQRRREEKLEKQVEILQEKLEKVNEEIALSKIAEPLDETVDTNLDSEESLISEESENPSDSNYDISLQIKPEKVTQIKSEIINGQKCIVIPIDEDEQVTVNGEDKLI